MWWPVKYAHPILSLSHSETLGHLVPYVFFFLKSFEFTGNLEEWCKMLPL